LSGTKKIVRHLKNIYRENKIRRKQKSYLRQGQTTTPAMNCGETRLILTGGGETGGKGSRVKRNGKKKRRATIK